LEEKQLNTLMPETIKNANTSLVLTRPKKAGRHSSAAKYTCYKSQQLTALKTV
jgi:hypothetical protein